MVGQPFGHLGNDPRVFFVALRHLLVHLGHCPVGIVREETMQLTEQAAIAGDGIVTAIQTHGDQGNQISVDVSEDSGLQAPDDDVPWPVWKFVVPKTFRISVDDRVNLVLTNIGP